MMRNRVSWRRKVKQNRVVVIIIKGVVQEREDEEDDVFESLWKPVDRREVCVDGGDNLKEKSY